MQTPNEPRYIRESPPRSVNFLTALIILFSGFMSQFGWFFFGFGMIFVWIFGVLSNIGDLASSKSDWIRGEARITSIQGTNSEENGQDVYRYVYSFEHKGESYESSSLSTSTSIESGQLVPIEYNSENPEESSILGTRSNTFPWFVPLLCMLFPAAGLAILIPAFIRNYKALQLIRNGIFTRGTLVGKNATNATIEINNDKYPVYAFEFSFETEDGQTHIAHTRTHLPESIEDEEEEIILYDAGNPDFNVVYDSVSNAPLIAADGSLMPPSLMEAKVLLIPAASLFGHGFLVLLFFF